MTSSRTAFDDLFSHVVSLIVQNLTGLDLWHRLRPAARDYFRTRLRCERAADELLSGLDLRYEKAAKTRTGGQVFSKDYDGRHPLARYLAGGLCKEATRARLRMLAPTAAGPIAADPADTRRGDADLAIDVTAALNGLPDVLRQLVVLVRFGRHSIPNAGRALGLKRTTAYERYDEAMHLLRESLAGYESRG